jgi:hypothetical protein
MAAGFFRGRAARATTYGQEEVLGQPLGGLWSVPHHHQTVRLLLC